MMFSSPEICVTAETNPPQTANSGNINSNIFVDVVVLNGSSIQ